MLTCNSTTCGSPGRYQICLLNLGSPLLLLSALTTFATLIVIPSRPLWLRTPLLPPLVCILKIYNIHQTFRSCIFLKDDLYKVVPASSPIFTFISTFRNIQEHLVVMYTKFSLSAIKFNIAKFQCITLYLTSLGVLKARHSIRKYSSLCKDLEGPRCRQRLVLVLHERQVTETGHMMA